MCLQKDQHTNVCTTHTGCRVYGTHTRTHMQLAGIPPSTPQHEEGVQRQTWRVCVVVVVWATGRHASRGGHGQLHSCSAWIPPVPSQEKRENEGGRGSQRVSRCDLCWHCMSMLMKKEKEGEGRGRYAPFLFMLLSFGCLPATALCTCCTPGASALPRPRGPEHMRVRVCAPNHVRPHRATSGGFASALRS